MIKQHQRTLLTVFLVSLLLIGIMSIPWSSPRISWAKQAQLSPSAVPFQFPTPTETAGPPTETPTRTPTAPDQAMVEANDSETNVRAGPNLSDTKIGQIEPGTRFPVIGKYGDWYHIEFASSPNGVAWVYRGVVTLTGDETLIPEIRLEDIPALDPAYLAQQETLENIRTTPGGIATLTAQAMITPTGNFTVDPAVQSSTPIPGPLPTFTFPPYTVTPVAIPRTNPATESTGIAPIVPILALSALGLMGLLVAFLRRL